MPVEAVAHELIEQKAISAVVGRQISGVLRKLAKIIGGRVPYVYTPLYEGNEGTPGIFALGETPQEQLRPAIRRIAEIHHVKKWALVGNDYVWPRFSHRSEEHTSELQSLMRISYAVFCLKKKTKKMNTNTDANERQQQTQNK